MYAGPLRENCDGSDRDRTTNDGVRHGIIARSTTRNAVRRIARADYILFIIIIDRASFD